MFLSTQLELKSKLDFNVPFRTTTANCLQDHQKRAYTYQSSRLSLYRLTPPPITTILPPTQQPERMGRTTRLQSSKLIQNLTSPFNNPPFLAQKQSEDQRRAQLSKVRRIRTSKDGSVIAISCDGSMAFSYLSRVSHKTYWMRELRLKSESQLRHCITRIKQQIGAIVFYMVFAGILRLYSYARWS